MDKVFSILRNYQTLHNEIINTFDISHLIPSQITHRNQAQLAIIIISLNAALEVLVKDVLANYIESRSPMNLDFVSRVSLKYEDVESGRLHHILVEKLLGEIKTKDSKFIKYIELTNKFPEVSANGLSGDDKKLLSEFSAVRNIIAHNNSCVDVNFLKSTPWLGESTIIGQRFVITNERFFEYFFALNNYVNHIIVKGFANFYNFNIAIGSIDFNKLSHLDPRDEVSIRQVLKLSDDEIAAANRAIRTRSFE